MVDRSILDMAARALCDRASRGATEKQIEATRIAMMRQLDALFSPEPAAPAEPIRRQLAVRESAALASSVST